MKRLILMSVAILLAASALRADWPTLHNDPQRSGYSSDVVKGPYERKWFRNFAEEMISTRVEAIVAEDKVFIGTLAGNVYALDVETGETVWQFQADGPIGHSPCYMDGKLYVGADEGFDTGSVYCINAADGKELWRAKVDAGVFTSPLCDGQQVYFGDRGGVFHAVKVSDGSEAWTHATDYMILQPPSLSADGQAVVFGSEDMHVYALATADGKELWKTDKLGGLSLRDHAPTIWTGKAIVRTNPAHGFHGTLGQDAKDWKKLHESLPKQGGDEVIFNEWGKYAMKYSDRRAAAERDFVREFVKNHAAQKTFYAFRLDDGNEPWVAPVTFGGVGLHSNPPYPVYKPDGTMFVWGGTSLSKEGFGVPGLGLTIMTIDPETGDTTDVIRNGPVPTQPSDETQSLSLMGDILLNTHQGSVLGLNLETMKRHDIYRARDSYGGIFGQVYHRTQAPYKGFYTGVYLAQREGEICMMANQWHGPDSSICAISNDRLFWVVGSQVVCLGGPSTPKQPSGGKDRAKPMQWEKPHYAPGGNLAVYWMGDYDKSMKRPEISGDDLAKFVDVAAAAPKTCSADGELAKKVAARLEAEVLELTSQPQWAPLIIELGISGDQSIFADAAQAMQIVAMALPHLSPDAKAKALAWLDERFEAGYPLQKNEFHPKQGKRREPYEVGPTMSGKTDKPKPDLSVLYAVWAYAHYGDRWEKVKAQQSRIEELLTTFSKQPPLKDHAGNEFNKDNKLTGRVNHIGEELNGQIAGMIGYIRIMKEMGKASAAKDAMDWLAAIVVERIHHEQADTCFIRNDVYGAHSARLPRYLKLTPEVGAMLQAFAGKTTQGYLTELSAELPVWYQAWGERLVGGENYCNPPHLARSMYMGWAEAADATPETLAKVLDQPWCKADLFYIEKCSALLRAAAK